MSIKKSHVIKALREVIFPDAGKNIIDLEMVKNIKIASETITFDVLLPTANNPNKDSLKNACIKAIHEKIDKNISVEVNITSQEQSKQGKQDKQTEQGEQESSMESVKNIIAIASGKGGVGKSTVATNLAVAMANKGYNVGLLDADMFGPSIPKMFNAEGAQPVAENENGKDKIVPVEKYGVKMLSIGFFVKAGDATIWRGPMASNALKQLMNDGKWGELDYLFVDLPPGTSDIHLTLVQTVAVTGAIIVSTPQPMALADAVKGISMFDHERIQVPIVGLIENMAWFTPEELPENKYYIFGKEGVKNLAQERNVPFLGQIPIVQSIREDGDNGIPSGANFDTIVGKSFSDVADNTIKQIEKRNQNQAPTEKVNT